MADPNAMKENISINGKEYEPLADGTYDAVVLGTGLTECILSGLLSVGGLRVLHCDRNNYYGGKCASLNMKMMVDKFAPSSGGPNPELGSSRDYNIDLIPKFIMAGGNMVNMLLHTGVTRYLEFKLVDGSFVFTDDRPHKVPVTPKEAMTSSLMGLFEKNRCRSFFSFVHSYDHDDQSTHGGLDLETMPMAQLYEYYGLQPTTISFIGHALALYRDDSYMQKPALETIRKIQLYAKSLARHGRSPYLYPLYGLGELPQAFARLSAVHGGTYMLQTPIDEILCNDNGVAVGVRSGDRAAKCEFIAGDPSYFPKKVSHIGKVVRCYCILNHCPPNTKESTSCQIIVPAAQVSSSRKNDIYVLVLSNNHRTTPEDKYLALVSTTVETDDPHSELAPGLALLGEIQESFLSVDDVYEPKSNGKKERVYISRSYDATTHFETTMEDVLDLYKRIFGTELVMKTGGEAAGSSS